MKIAVISAPVPEKYLFPLISSGFGVVSSYLINKGYDIIQIDLSLFLRIFNNSRGKGAIDLSIFTPERVRRHLVNNDSAIENETKKIIKLSKLDKYNILCFSISSSMSLRILLPVFLQLKRENESRKIILGGSFTHNEPHLRTLAEYVDFIVWGDCEPLDKILRHILYGEKIDDFTGIITKERRGPITRFRSKLSEHPPPYYENRLLEMYGRCNALKIKIVPYQVGRGCVNRCTFCRHFKTPEYEYKPIPKVIQDLKLISNKYSNKIYFCESNFFNDTRYVENLCDALIRENIGVEWGCMATITNKSEDFFKKLRKAGCRYLMYGLESGSDSVLRRMKKPYNSKIASQILKRTYDAGINVYAFIITNFVNETWEEFYQTQEFLIQNSKYVREFSINVLELLRESELFNRHRYYNITIKDGPQKFIDDVGVEFDDINPAEVRKKLGLLKEQKLMNSIFIDYLTSLSKKPIFALKYLLNKTKYPFFDDYSVYYVDYH